MTKQEIENKLNDFQSKKIINQEYLDLIERWIIAQCEEDYGFVDDINDYKNIKVEKANSYTYYSNPNTKKIKTLYFFNHGGLSTPLEFVDFLKLDKWYGYAKCIYDNYDIGTRKVADELIKQLSQNPDLDYSVLFFDINRVVADSNRLRREEQLVDKAYRGDSMWSENKTKEERNVIAESLIDPFFDKMKSLVLRNNVKLVFNPHSYDTYGGGVSSSNHEKASAQEKRPPLTLLKKYAFEDEAFGSYDSRNNVDINLLEDNQIDVVRNVILNNLENFEIEEEEKKVPVDYPYISPRMAGGLVKSYFNGPVFATDIRKDLFKDNFENIMHCLNQIEKELSEKFN